MTKHPPLDFGWLCRCGQSGPHAEDFDAHKHTSTNASWSLFLGIAAFAITFGIFTAVAT